jgi:heme A synthase
VIQFQTYTQMERENVKTVAQLLLAALHVQSIMGILNVFYAIDKMGIKFRE